MINRLNKNRTGGRLEQKLALGHAPEPGVAGMMHGRLARARLLPRRPGSVLDARASYPGMDVYRSNRKMRPSNVLVASGRCIGTVRRE